MRLLKIQDKEYFPNGEWRYVANEKDKGKVDDEMVYHYVEDSINLADIKAGDTIFLDEDFKVLEVEKDMYDRARDVLMTWDKETLIRDILMDMHDNELQDFVEANA